MLNEKETLLIVAEGLREKRFLQHLVNLYLRSSKKNVSIKNGQGGTADGLIKYTANMFGSYDQRAALVDNDKPISEMGRCRELAREKNIVLIENTPCIEQFLLTLIEYSKPIPKKTPSCKTEFQKYLKSHGDNESNFYSVYLSKSLLNKKRKKDDKLNKIISIIE